MKRVPLLVTLLSLVACNHLTAQTGVLPGTVASVTVEPDTDRFGSDYRQIEGSSAEACRAECATDQACDAYSFYKPASRCYLKKGSTNPSPNGNIISGVKIRTGSGNRPAGAGGARDYPTSSPSVTVEPDTDRFGSDYRQIEGSSAEACRAECATDQACDAYSFYKPASRCYLKKGSTNPSPNGNIISGVKIRTGSGNRPAGAAGAGVDGSCSLNSDWPVRPSGFTLFLSPRRSGTSVEGTPKRR